MKKVLVANRGEIARRVLRTLNKMDIRSVAIYSDADANAPHVLEADEAVYVGQSPSSESYLQQDKIIQICKDLGVDGVHPGYGFLSENADFAQMVIDAGLIWIGPPPAAIRSLGDKVSARHIAQKVKAPLAPGLLTPHPALMKYSLSPKYTVFPLPSRQPTVVVAVASRSPTRWKKFLNSSSPPRERR